jgi:hypothetical protein
MPTNTYVQLRKTTVSVATNTVTLDLTGITGYTDLRVAINGGASGTANVLLQFNGDSSSGLYSYTSFGGDGSAASSQRANVTNSIMCNYYGYMEVGYNANFLVDIFQYSSSSVFKAILSRANNAGNGTAGVVGLWRNTAAVTSITFITGSNNFAVGNTFSVYGIAKGTAIATTAKATGGTIYFGADGYTYHKFTSSGTFTPSQALTDVDYLVVAGGGGGGQHPLGAGGGGGGAGGYRTTVGLTGGLGAPEPKLSLASGVAVTVTVGAGGPAGSSSNGTVGENSVFGTITAAGGGFGARGSDSATSNIGGTGGSGGGGGSNVGGTRTGGSISSPTQGFAGGTAQNQAIPFYSGGGGGGAGQVGQSPESGTGGKGGNGISNPAFAGATASGAATYYAGGGGGAPNSAASLGGTAGGTGGAGAVAATANLGAGGGGGYGSNAAAAGGSGIVIVRYTS